MDFGYDRVLPSVPTEILEKKTNDELLAMLDEYALKSGQNAANVAKARDAYDQALKDGIPDIKTFNAIENILKKRGFK